LKEDLSSYGCLGRDRQTKQGFFSGMLRGVSNPGEGSEILSFPFRPRLVCSSLLHLRSSWRDCMKSGSSNGSRVDVAGNGRQNEPKSRVL
jgi:hypothetical protein